MRKSLWFCSGVVVLSLMLCCVTGCGGNADGEKTRAGGFEKKQNSRMLRISMLSEPKTFNPVLASDNSSMALLDFMFAGLVEIDPETVKPKPELAKSWSVSDDHLVWTFNLRDDVVWSDGHKFTADDVIFTFEKVIYNPDVPSSLKSIFTVDGKEFKFEKKDDYTVAVTTPVPYAPFLFEMQVGILPKHALEKAVEEKKFASAWGVDEKPENIVCTGAFVLDEFVPGQRILLKKNPRYYKKDENGQPLPRINGIQVLIVQNTDVGLLKFQAGEIDVVSFSGKDYRAMNEGMAKGNYALYDCGPGLGADFLTFFQSTAAPDPVKSTWFEDVNFRKAVACAIDYQSIIENIFFGQAAKAVSVLPEAAGDFYNPDVEKYGFDLEKAAKLLADSGFKDFDGDGILERPQGIPVEFTIITNSGNKLRMDQCEIIRSDLSKLGFKVSVTGLDFNNLIAKLMGGKGWDAAFLGFGGVIEPHAAKNVWDPYGRLHVWNLCPAFMGGDKQRVERWYDSLPSWEKKIRELFIDGVSEFDTAKRVEIYHRWQKLALENVPLIYTVSAQRLFAVSNRVKGVKPLALGGVLHNTEELELED